MADALSRTIINALSSMPSTREWTTLPWPPIREDPDVQAYPDSGWSTSVLVQTGKLSFVTPPQANRDPLSLLGGGAQFSILVHGLSHPSIRATRQLVASKFVWHSFREQGGLWAKARIPCQTSKVHGPRSQHFRFPIVTLTTSTWIWLVLFHLLVDTLPVVDRFTRWPEAIPLSDTTTHTCALALVSNWMARFGIPMDMSSDRGSQQLWAAISQLLGTKLHHTTAYHPVERPGRAIPPGPEVRLTCPPDRTHLVKRVTMGTLRHQDSP